MANPTLLTVLRSGGDFTADHVHALRRGVARHWPKDRPLDFACLTDTRLGLYGVREIPMMARFPGWWSKCEMLRYDIPGTVLYLDLDCIILGDPSDLAAIDELAVLRDFYRPKGLQTALMVLPEVERRAAWDAFLKDPAGIMGRYRSDQEWLETLWLDKAARVQDLVPGQVVGYKTAVREGGEVPEGARVVMFHGRPRPWETDLWDDGMEKAA